MRFALIATLLVGCGGAAPVVTPSAPITVVAELRYPDGSRRAVGHYQDGVRVGVWREWHPNGKLWTVGAYVDGKRDGRWIEYSHNGLVIFEGTYRAGVVDGAWVAYDEDGEWARQGVVVDGKLEGEVSLTRGRVRVVRGYRGNKPHGRWARYLGDELLYEATYVDGLLEGDVVEYENGAVKTVETYRAGELIATRGADADP